MIIRLADEKDYSIVGKMRWLHAVEDDKVYGEKNTSNVDEHEYISKVIDFLNKNKDYKIFIAEENGTITASMFIYLVPKIPTPNGNSEFIAYLTKVFTKEEYRNKGIGTEMLNYIKEYLKKINCELIFACVAVALEALAADPSKSNIKAPGRFALGAFIFPPSRCPGCDF